MRWKASMICRKRMRVPDDGAIGQLMRMVIPKQAKTKKQQDSQIEYGHCLNYFCPDVPHFGINGSGIL